MIIIKYRWVSPNYNYSINERLFYNFLETNIISKLLNLSFTYYQKL